MKVVVAGGSGFIGRHLVSAFRTAGDEVRVLTRAPRAAGEVAWDGRTLGAWAAEVDGADAVVNLAGASTGKRWTAAHKCALLKSRLDSTDVLVAAIAAAARPPRVLVNASGIDFSGNSGDAVVDEDAAPGDSFLAHVCVAWEASAARAPVRSVAVRTPLSLGRDADALRLIALPFKLGVGGPYGSGRQWFPWIHVEDVVAVYRLAIEDESLAGPLNAVAPELLRQRDTATMIGRVLHRPSLVPAPAFALRTLLGGQADLLLHGQRAVSRKLDGFSFRYGAFEEALREALG